MEPQVHITSIHNPSDYVLATGWVVANVIVFISIWLVVLVLLCGRWDVRPNRGLRLGARIS